MTVAPAAGTSPEPQGAGSRGLSLTPATATLECPGPNGPPPRAPSHSSTASPLSPKNENFLPAYPVPSEADSCHPGNDPSERPSRSPRIPSALLKLVSTTPSNTPEHLSPSGTHPWIPGPEAVARGGGGGGPTLNPLHLLLRLRPDWPGLRLRRGAGRRAPSGRRVSPIRHGESAK